MPRFILYEDSRWQRFLPLVYLRGVFELRCGVGELWQRVERLAASGAESTEAEVWCRPQLEALVQERMPRSCNRPANGDCLLLNGRGFWKRLPTVSADSRPWIGTAGHNGDVACVYADSSVANGLSPDVMLDATHLENAVRDLPRRDVSHLVTLFDWPWDIVHFNATAVEDDFRTIRPGGTRHSRPGVFLLHPDRIHIGAGSRIKPCVVIDAEEGPVWIGANVTVEPHAVIQGPCYIGNDCLIQPGAMIREGCSIGRRCKIGGEVEASIVQGFSNKQHDGFLGHAYLGEWINIGADCLNSDLKNTYGTVRVPINGEEVDTGEQFVGLFMGDYSKTGINVAFPTGAVVGLCSNVVDPLPPKFVPSFTWLDQQGRRPFDIDRAITSARKMMSRRNREFTPSAEAAFRRAREDVGVIESRGTE